MMIPGPGGGHFGSLQEKQKKKLNPTSPPHLPPSPHPISLHCYSSLSVVVRRGLALFGIVRRCSSYFVVVRRLVASLCGSAHSPGLGLLGSPCLASAALASPAPSNSSASRRPADVERCRQGEQDEARQAKQGQGQGEPARASQGYGQTD